MEKDTVGLKIAKYDSLSTVVSILRKYTDFSISEIMSRINNNDYVLLFDYTDHEGVKTIIKCYSELKDNSIEASLFEMDDEPTSIDLLNNLNQMYSEISDEVDAMMDAEAEEDD